MGRLTYPLLNIAATLLRMLPWPTRTGLRMIGNPGRDAPVLLTGNFVLTVARVMRALKGLDAWLLVANSRGINVWCAATGGLLTNHDVISVIKTSGIEERVDHHRLILPQLAATGVETKEVSRKTGWKPVWGPVYAEDIPVFLENKYHKTAGMREVVFPLIPRFEMAVAWAFPISVVLALILLPFWRGAIIPLSVLVWGLSLLVFVAFPWYERWLDAKGKRLGFVFFDFGRGGVQLILWGIILLGLAGYSLLQPEFSTGFMLRWGLVSLVVVVLVSIDLMGSTPLYKSGLHEDRQLAIVLDESRCKGAAFCEQVCPRNCYEVDHDRHLAVITEPELCVQCGACIVQCPFDALQFQTPRGEFIPPETIRRFKLNMMGSRAKPA